MKIGLAHFVRVLSHLSGHRPEAAEASPPFVEVIRETLWPTGGLELGLRLPFQQEQQIAARLVVILSELSLNFPRKYIIP
jgi:hypothetical protein